MNQKERSPSIRSASLPLLPRSRHIRWSTLPPSQFHRAKKRAGKLRHEIGRSRDLLSAGDGESRARNTHAGLDTLPSRSSTGPGGCLDEQGRNANDRTWPPLYHTIIDQPSALASLGQPRGTGLGHSQTEELGARERKWR